MVALLRVHVAHVWLNHSSVQNLSDTVHIDMVSLLWEYECGQLGGSSGLNTSDNIHTDMVWCESECAVSEDVSPQNISDNIHIDMVSRLFSPCVRSAYVLIVPLRGQNSSGNTHTDTVSSGVSRWCESERARSDNPSVQNTSDNIYIDVVLCESVCVVQKEISGKNISGNIHIDMSYPGFSRLYEPEECAPPGHRFAQNISDNIHIWCEYECGLLGGFSGQTLSDN